MGRWIIVMLMSALLSACFPPPPPGATSWIDTEAIERWRRQQRFAEFAEKEEKRRAAAWEKEKRQDKHYQGRGSARKEGLRIVAATNEEWLAALDKHVGANAYARFRVGDGSVGVLLAPAWGARNIMGVAIRREADMVVIHCRTSSTPTDGSWWAMRVWTDGKPLQFLGCPH